MRIYVVLFALMIPTLFFAIGSNTPAGYGKEASQIPRTPGWRLLTNDITNMPISDPSYARYNYYYSDVYSMRPESYEFQGFWVSSNLYETDYEVEISLDEEGYVTEQSFRHPGYYPPYYRKKLYTYDHQNHLISLIDRHYDDLGMPSYDNYRQYWVYDAENGYELFTMISIRDQKTQSYFKNTFQWDVQGRIIERTSYSSTDSMSWVPAYKTYTTWNIQDQTTGDQYLDWVAQESVWTDLDIGIPYFGMMEEQLTYRWDGNELTPYRKQAFTYDNEQLIQMSYSEYTNNAWVESSHTNYSYSLQNGTCILINSLYFDAETGDWVPYKVNVLTWEAFISTDNDQCAPPAIPLRLSAYPSPFREKVSLHIETKSGASIEFQVYNLKGQFLDRFQGDPSMPTLWKADQDLPSGVYFIKARQAGSEAVIKVIHLK